MKLEWIKEMGLTPLSRIEMAFRPLKIDERTGETHPDPDMMIVHFGVYIGLDLSRDPPLLHYHRSSLVGDIKSMPGRTEECRQRVDHIVYCSELKYK